MTNNILTLAPTTAKPVVCAVDSEWLEIPFDWGHHDATEGRDCTPDLFRRMDCQQAYSAGYADGVAQMRILYGDPILAHWVLDGSPTGNFDWTGKFDVCAAVDRDDWIGA